MKVEDWTKKRKEGFKTALTTGIKKDPTKSIRKHFYELKVHKKTTEDSNKQDVSTHHNQLDYATVGELVLENKTNATFYPNIDSLKTSIKEE